MLASQVPRTVPRVASQGTLQQLLELARSTVYMLIKDDGVPKPVNVIRRTSAWGGDEVQAYLDRQRTEPNG
jgi:predicted DNA-binding transcriptional regulator AlpA